MAIVKRLGALLVCTLIFAPMAEARRLAGDFSGAAIQAQTDINGDGDNSTSATAAFEGRSSFGVVTTTGASEFLVWDGMSFCGSTAVTVNYAAASAVMRFDSGDLLYLKLIAGSACYDYVNHSFTFSYDSSVTGGTGSFAGATGVVTTTGKGQNLLFDANDRGVLTAVRGTFKGDVATPPR